MCVCEGGVIIQTKVNCVCTQEVCSKSIKTVALFTQTEVKNEWNINFFQNSPLYIQNTFFQQVLH